MEVEKLSKAMTEIRAQDSEKATRDRKTSIQKYNDKTHMRLPNLRCDLFGSSHGEELCVAKDETSVDVICRRFC
jgi:hypothetical protein